jgi:hypothetical protein
MVATVPENATLLISRRAVLVTKSQMIQAIMISPWQNRLINILVGARRDVGAGGIRQQEVHHASHGHRCLPVSKLTKCMEVNEATFAEMAKASVLKVASVTADVVVHSGLGRDWDA